MTFCDLSLAQQAECRHGVKVGEPSNMTQIVPPPPEEGRHVRWGSRTTPTADWWFLMIKDQSTCACELGPLRWDRSYEGRTCGRCGKPPGKHRRQALMAAKDEALQRRKVPHLADCSLRTGGSYDLRCPACRTYYQGTWR